MPPLPRKRVNGGRTSVTVFDANATALINSSRALPFTRIPFVLAARQNTEWDVTRWARVSQTQQDPPKGTSDLIDKIGLILKSTFIYRTSAAGFRSGRKGILQ